MRRLVLASCVVICACGRTGKVPVAPGWVGDADHDGVADAADLCPDKAEDFDGFKDGDGCPDIDNDGDGVPDTDDQCPSVKADKSGAADPSGCPGVARARLVVAGAVVDVDPEDPPIATPVVVVLPTGVDKDKDGIDDSVDRCPNLREDGVDGDGCPGTDADKDKIPNAKDKCPEQPEDWDTVQDDDGCPEVD